MKNANEKYLNKLSGGKVRVDATGRVGVVEQTVQGNTLLREPNSDMIAFLSKAVIEQDYLPAKMKFFTQIFWPIRFVKNGILDKFYEVSVEQAKEGNPVNDMVIGDFAKVPEIVAEETFELTADDINQYDYQIFDAELADFATSADKAVSVIRTQAGAKWRSFGKVNQGKVLSAIFENVTEEIDTSGMDIIEKQKTIDQTFTKYSSESETLISEDIGGATYTFDTQFNQEEFIGIFNKNFSAEYKIDLKRNSFQIGNNTGVVFNLAGTAVRDFETSIGFPDFVDAEETKPIANVELIFVHKDAIDNLGQFEMSKLMGTLQGYTKGRDFMKNNAFKVKGKPIIMFYSGGTEPTPSPSASLSNITTTDPTVAGGSDGNITFDATISDFVETPTATLTPTSGTTPLTLADGANTGLTFEALPAGEYTISIMDGSSEITTGTASLIDPEVI